TVVVADLAFIAFAEALEVRALEGVGEMFLEQCVVDHAGRISLGEADVDAAILAPALFVGALRVELATRRVAELVARNAEAAEEAVH
ncbi:hypothetical protein G6O44_25350, partial [Salmonella enterica subsp. enterica serovar Enteritidis]|nr:hypothetical protein [Salmonella enterica subsp. enterica serovar Enteritidis]